MPEFPTKSIWYTQFFLLSGLALASNLFALAPKKRITQYDIRVYQAEHGLPMNDIKDVFQDSKGYIWVATQEGLVRFDGETFVLYDKSKYPGLSENFIWDIEEDWNGNLWLATQGGGVASFDGRQFTSYDTGDGLSSNVVTEIEVSQQDKSIWFGTHDGFTVFEGGGFVASRLSAVYKVWEIFDNQNGQILTANTAGTLYIIDLSADSTYFVSLPNEEPATSILMLKSRELVVGGFYGSLYGFKNDQFYPYSPSRLPGQNRITAMLEDRHGNIWFGREGSGIFRYRLLDNSLDSLSVGEGLPINNGFINEIIEDREGSLWFATGDGLVQMVDNKFVTFGTLEGMPSNFGHTVCEDADGNIWAGFRPGGLAMLDDNQVMRFDTRDGLLSDEVLSVIPARRGGIWIGTTEGLNSLTNSEVRAHQEIRKLRPWWSIFALTENQHGALWLGMAFGGLLKFEGGDFEQKCTLPGSEATDIICVLETSTGEVWFGTRKAGLYKVTENGAVRVGAEEDFEGDGVNALYEDMAGILWIATDGHGLYRFCDQQFFQYTSSQGLAFDRLFSILEDDQNNLWFSGNRGIFRVRKSQLDSLAAGRAEWLECISYNHLDGMREAECNGRRQPVAWKSRDGRLWFASLAGIVSVDPNNMPHNSVVPPVFIEAVETRASSRREGAPRIRQYMVEADSAFLALDAGERDLEFRFAALSFVVPERVNFKYKLEDHDPDWVDAGTRRSASYTNLAKGLYTFSVQACNNDGVWNLTGASVQFRIPPFWWETWWAYALYGALIIGLLYGIRRYELSRKQLKYHLQLERRELELKQKETQKLQELDHLKSRFFANISHEFRTPLTLILGPLKRLQEGSFRGDAEKQLGMMGRNAQRLLGLINQLLDLSKLDAGKLTLSARKSDLVHFLKGVISSFESLALQKKISLSFEYDPCKGSEPSPGFPLVYFDPEKMEQILSNLLSNALKFTPQGGAVTVVIGRSRGIQRPSSTATGTDNFVQITVKDNGIGISFDKLPHIFDRFYQVSESLTKDHSGTGIGLALTKELVELHRGQIQVSSKVGKGTEFVVRLPLGKGHLKPAEIGEPKDFPGFQNLGGPDYLTPDPQMDDGASTIEHPVSSFQGRAPSDAAVILIVEDNVDMRDYIRELLSSQYRILEAADGEAGWQMARERLPDVIISDVMMPRLDGFELCRRLKGEELTCHIPIILLTAKGSNESRLVGLGQGADGYLSKPFDQEELNLRITNLLQHQRRLQKKFQQEITLFKAMPENVELPSQDLRFLQRAKGIVETNLEDSDFSVARFAREMAFSKVHLNRKLKALTGESTSEFILSLRLERAAQLLRKDAHRITEIAYLVGFNNLSYFARSFKERFGLTPSAYQKEHRLP